MTDKLLSRVGFIFLIFSIVVLFDRCKKDEATTPGTETSIQFLGHKGGGSSYINPSTVENTIPAIQKGLLTLTGIEVDVQMSLDGTIWLFHDLDLSDTSCGSIPHKTIILSRDIDIAKINICSSQTQDKIYKLSELINFRNQSANPFYTSLHIKLDFPADSLNKPAIGGEAIYLSKFADNMAKVMPSVKNPEKILIEVYDATFCKKIQQLVPGIKVCLLKEVTFPKQIDDAIALGYNGVSCIFNEPTVTAAEVARAQANGLIVQLWTPDTKQELSAVFNLNPNTIQTNNLDAMVELNVFPKK
jgi:glycerophosphoryl diester phosphodiesterase